MKLLKILVMVCAVALLTVGTASASFITYSTSYGPTNTDYTTNLVLPQWNQSSFLGQVLTGVTLNFTFADNVNTITLTNTSTSAQGFKVNLTADIYTGPQTVGLTTLVGPPDLLVLNDIGVTLFASGNIALGPSGSGACPFATPSTACSIVQYDPGIVTGSSTVNANPANFGFYTGSGNFSTGAMTMSGTTFVGGGNNIQLGISDSATVTETVTYYYQASGVPEPATFGLLGSALIALGVIRRKKLAR